VIFNAVAIATPKPMLAPEHMVSVAEPMGATRATTRACDVRNRPEPESLNTFFRPLLFWGLRTNARKSRFDCGLAASAKTKSEDRMMRKYVGIGTVFLMCSAGLVFAQTSRAQAKSGCEGLSGQALLSCELISNATDVPNAKAKTGRAQAKRGYKGLWVQTLLSCDLISNATSLSDAKVKGALCGAIGESSATKITVSRSGGTILFKKNQPAVLTWNSRQRRYEGTGSFKEGTIHSIVRLRTAWTGGVRDTYEVKIAGKSVKYRKWHRLKID
jgi:hypothetical protein